MTTTVPTAEPITCPGLGCRGEAVALPDGNVYCLDTRSLVPPDPDDVPVMPRRIVEDPEHLLTLLHVCADANGITWDRDTYPAQVQAAGRLLHILNPQPPAGRQQYAGYDR